MTRPLPAPGSAPLLAVAALVGAVLVVLAPARAVAAPFDLQGQDWEGLSQLVRIAESELGTQRVVPTATLKLDELKREDGLLLVHPTRALDVDELSTFMRAGGRLALLDDYGTGTDLLARFGIRRVPCPSRPAEMLRENPSFAIAEAASAHPIVRDAGRVVTNHATGLAHPGLSPLLVVRGNGEPDVLVAMAGAVGHGRLIAVGDGSVVINAMMRYSGNRSLSRALVRYLVDDDVWGRRGGKLYVLVNGFETAGAFGDPSRVGGLVAGARRAVLGEIEVLRHDGMSPAVAYLAALILGLGVLAWTSARVGRTHREAPPRFTRAVPAVMHGGIAGHAAVLASPGASRTLAVLELKSSLEEQFATRLGLERAPPRDELVARVRAAGLLDDERAGALAKLLAELGLIESHFAHLARASAPVERVGDARVVSVAARVRELLEAMRPADAHDTVGRAP